MTGQTWVIEPVAKATAEQELPDQQLWFGVLAPYRRHATVPLFFGKFVHRRRGEEGHIVFRISNTSMSAGNHFTLYSSSFDSHRAASCSLRCRESVNRAHR